jgi:hypothetical protein
MGSTDSDGISARGSMTGCLSSITGEEEGGFSPWEKR